MSTADTSGSSRGRDRISTAIRLPRELHDRVLAIAQHNTVSVNLVVTRAVEVYVAGDIDQVSHLQRTVQDRDEWNDHLAHEVSRHVLAVPRVLRRWYLARVDRLRRAES